MKKLYYEKLEKCLDRNIFIFFITTFFVLLIQFDTLKPTLEIGFTPDDWSFVFWYKALGSNPLSKIAEVWSIRGPYTTMPMYYTGIIHSLVGFDYQKVQLISIFFKTLATLVIFPSVLIFFRNRLLACLATILFAMAYPASGPLETVVEPSEYLGMFSMGIFLIVYYHVVKNHLLNWKWLGFATILLLITVILSIMRLYPLLVLVPVIELYILLQKRSLNSLKASLLRLGYFFLPFVLITLFRPNLILSYIGVTPTILIRVIEGNWHLLLTPLQGIAHTLPVSANLWKIFGYLSLDNFNDYFSFLLGGPMVIFGLVIFSLSILTAKKPWRFFILAFGLNFFLEIMIFFIANHYLSLPAGQRLIFDDRRVYPTLFGLLILTLSFVYWIEWKFQSKSNNLLIALWAGPAISLLFIVLTWLLASENLEFGGGAQDHYLMIPSAGNSLFVAGLLVLIYEYSKTIKLNLIKRSMEIAIFIMLIISYLLNKNLIYSYFKQANVNGRAAEGQRFIQAKFKEAIKGVDFRKPMFFYFDTSELSGDGPFYTEGLLSSLPFLMHFNGNDMVGGCVEVYYENREKLALLIKEQGKEKGFVYKGLCVKGNQARYETIYYKKENIYAFKIKNRDFVDIRAETLKYLGF